MKSMKKKPLHSGPPKTYRNFFESVTESVPRERIQAAEARAADKVLAIRLMQLREALGVKQTDVPGFSQSSVSKLEARGDMLVSTIVNYVHSLGCELRIVAIPKKTKKGKRTGEEVILLEA